MISHRANNIGSGTWSLIQSLLGIGAIIIAYVQWTGWKKESEAHFKAEGMSYELQSAIVIYDTLGRLLDKEESSFPVNIDRIEKLKRHRKIQLDIQESLSQKIGDHYGTNSIEIEVDPITEAEIKAMKD